MFVMNNLSFFYIVSFQLYLLLFVKSVRILTEMFFLLQICLTREKLHSQSAQNDRNYEASLPFPTYKIFAAD